MSIFNGFPGGFDHYDSGHATHSANRAASAARDAKTELRFLEQRLERLSMICEGMWTLLKERHGYSDNDLAAEMAKLDLADGKADGRSAKPKARPCPQCGRTISRRHTTCMYCGMLVNTQPFK